jgi:hypothetical protein
VPSRNLQKELECLYARRDVIDDLIESLEKYDRFREKGRVDREIRTA